MRLPLLGSGAPTAGVGLALATAGSTALLIVGAVLGVDEWTGAGNAPVAPSAALDLPDGGGGARSGGSGRSAVAEVRPARLAAAVRKAARWGLARAKVRRGAHRRGGHGRCRGARFSSLAGTTGARRRVPRRSRTGARPSRPRRRSLPPNPSSVSATCRGPRRTSRARVPRRSALRSTRPRPTNAPGSRQPHGPSAAESPPRPRPSASRIERSPNRSAGGTAPRASRSGHRAAAAAPDAPANRGRARASQLER